MNESTAPDLSKQLGALTRLAAKLRVMETRAGEAASDASQLLEAGPSDSGNAIAIGIAEVKAKIADLAALAEQERDKLRDANVPMPNVEMPRLPQALVLESIDRQRSGGQTSWDI